MTYFPALELDLSIPEGNKLNQVAKLSDDGLEDELSLGSGPKLV